VRSEFKNCNTSIGPRSQPNIDLDVTQHNSDFRTIVAAVIRRVQIVTSVIAIGIIVWIGMVLALPVSSEAKEKAKSKVLSVVFGFLVMIAATIIVN
jgi:Type IV secretion system pilin